MGRRYIKSEAIKELEREYHARKLAKDPGIKKIYFSDRTAPELEKSITAYICLKGWQCEKIQSMGRTIYKDGKPIFVRNNWQTGTADLSAIVNGRSLRIEVKCKWTGDNLQSEVQKKYQRKIEKAKGVYFIARTFEQFKDWFDTYLQALNLLRL